MRYSEERIPRTRGGHKLDGGPDYHIEKDASERQIDLVLLVQCGG